MTTRAYVVQISADDSVTTTVAGGSPVAGVAADRQTEAFFGYLSAFAPVATLATGTCSKSPSSGTTTIVTYLGSTSPDVSCAGETLQTNELYQAETALVQTITPFPSIAVAAGTPSSARGEGAS